MLKFLAKRWLLMLALIVMALAFRLILNQGDAQRAGHIKELISAGNYVEAIDYVHDIGRKKFNIKEEEQAYIDVFVAAFPGAYRGMTKNNEYLYIYAPGVIGYSTSVSASAKYSYTLSDYKQSRIYLFTSSALYESGEEIKEAALSDNACCYDYKYLDMKNHQNNPYITVFTPVPVNRTDQALSSFSYNIKNKTVTYDSVSLQNIV